VALELPAARLAPLLDDDVPALGGTIVAQVDRAQLARGWPTALQARAVWRDATLGDGAVTLGEVVADAAVRPDGSIGGAMRDDGRGEVAVAGRYRILPLGWTLQLELTPRRDDARVRRALARFGAPAADGRVVLRIKRGVVW
ncbi:type II secretion system protein N, partial [Mizugakiibacter sediminis]